MVSSSFVYICVICMFFKGHLTFLELSICKHHLWLKSIYIYIYLFTFLIRPIVSLHKTLIPRLGLCLFGLCIFDWGWSVILQDGSSPGAELGSPGIELHIH